MAKYSFISLDDLQHEKTYEHRYILCRVISETFKSPNDGSIIFLVQDIREKTNRVIRVSVYEPPSSWGMFCFQKEQQIAILNPNWQFGLDYEPYIKVNSPAKNILFFAPDVDATLKILNKCINLKMNSLEIKNQADTCF